MVEKFQILREQAKKNIQIADHMLSVTYNLLHDPKLLLAILENIFLSYTNAMSALLYHDRLFKEVPPFQDNFESKFRMFKEYTIHKHKLDKSFIIVINDIKGIIEEHRKSPMEFSRKGRFVICSGSYNIKTIGADEIRLYIDKAKVFIQAIDNITTRNERIFR